MDTNGDGFITCLEIRKALTSFGKEHSFANVLKMVNDADKNKDGRVEWEEFLDLVIAHEEVKKLGRQKSAEDAIIQLFEKSCEGSKDSGDSD